MGRKRNGQSKPESFHGELNQWSVCPGTSIGILGFSLEGNFGQSGCFYQQDRIIGAIEIFSENTIQLSMLKELDILKKEVFTDKLTQVGNRKFAEFNLATRFGEMTRHDIPFGMLFVDIDRFKHINDTHGHNIGDQVPQMVSKTALGILRSLDTLCRWGGDEFIVIVPNVDLQALTTIAEKIRMFVEKTWLVAADKTIRLTVSIGGTMAAPGDEIQSLVHRSDVRMYHSKEKGRNTVSIV